MEQDAYGYLGITPLEIYDYTPREYSNMSKAVGERQERAYEDRAVQSIMDVRAMYEKGITVDKLLGKNDRMEKKRNDDEKTDDYGRRVVSMEEKKKELSDLESTLGKAVSK